jgi:hypothetical protein
VNLSVVGGRESLMAAIDLDRSAMFARIPAAFDADGTIYRLTWQKYQRVRMCSDRNNPMIQGAVGYGASQPDPVEVTRSPQLTSLPRCYPALSLLIVAKVDELRGFDRPWKA